MGSPGDAVVDGKRVTDLKRRCSALAKRVASAGPILQGTVIERVISRKAGDGNTKTKDYGPYYQWTFKSSGKTTTVNLTAAQAKFVRRAIENNRAVEQRLSEMRSLSRQICEASANGVVRRPRNTDEHQHHPS